MFNNWRHDTFTEVNAKDGRSYHNTMATTELNDLDASYAVDESVISKDVASTGVSRNLCAYKKDCQKASRTR